MSDARGRSNYELARAARTISDNFVLLLACEHDKVATLKGSVHCSKVEMKGFGIEYHVFKTAFLICSLILQLIQIDEAFKVNGSKHTHTQPISLSCFKYGEKIF